MKPFSNLNEAIAYFQSEEKCKDLLEKMRWPDRNVICPKCGTDHAYLYGNMKWYKCRSQACKNRFTVTVGTVIESSKLPLSKWFTAIYLITAHKKGISSCQLARDLGIGQKAAWFVLHRVREMLRDNDNFKLDNIVEVDEVYIGGKVSNMHKAKRRLLRDEGNTLNTKTLVMGLIERSGNLKLLPFGKVTGLPILHPIVKQNVNKDAVVITDGYHGYFGLNKFFAGHESVNHAEQEYVRDSVIHTNSIEGAFGLFKRSIYGIYHQITPKHLSRYCDETMFRYNLRKMKDADRFTYSLTKIAGRLTYKNLIQQNVPTQYEQTIFPMMEEKCGNKPSVLQLKDGVIVGKYPTIAEAARQTGFTRQLIRYALIGMRNYHRGFIWKYE